MKSASKAYPAHILKSLAAETTDTYPNTMMHVYTDGSALNAVEQAGYGLTIQYPYATCKDISEACGQHCNNYDAELKAIRSALQTISKDCDNPNPPCLNYIVISADSQSLSQQSKPSHRWAIPHWRAYIAKKLIVFQRDNNFTTYVNNM